jgi:galactose mutarotase-like enzyme
MQPTITANDKITRATFMPERGGINSSLILPSKDGAKEFLYQHDFFNDDTWPDLPGASPFCFPICGRLARNNNDGAYLYDGRIYHMDIHGFGWQLPWQVSDQKENQITLILQANEKTLNQYPFNFKVSLTYAVQPGKLICHQSYQNNDTKPMPYYAGFHPYLLTPPVNVGKEKVMLDFESDYRLQYNESLTDIVGRLEKIKMPISITDPLINEQLSVLKQNKKATLAYPNGDVIVLEAGGDDPNLFNYLQLYTMNDKPFICVEHWMGHPNALNTVSGVRWLAPGASEAGWYQISIEGCGSRTM